MDISGLALAAPSGLLVGLLLALLGGGGSIMATPLLLYVVGIKDTHVAIGTSALAVAVNALIGLGAHARAGTVKWPCAMVFALAGIAGAYLGSILGQAMDGRYLLLAFAGIMFLVGLAMLKRRPDQGDTTVRLSPRIALRLVPIGFIVGLASGFFGIGGGFLIVPGIMLGSGMAMLNAVGSSLFSVAAFGLTTSINYALAGLVDWPVAATFIASGAIGGIAGQKLAQKLSAKRGLLVRIFSGVIFLVSAYVAYRSLSEL